MLLVELISRNKPPRDRTILAKPESAQTFLLGQLGEEALLTPNPAVTTFIDIAVRCVTLPAGKRPNIDSIRHDLQRILTTPHLP